MRARASIAAIAPGEPVRCVVADDHPAILDVVCAFLEAEAGIDVAGRASDGGAALRLIADTRPHVALLDIRMPEIGGIEVARRLAVASSPTSVVLYTAEPAPDQLVAALDAGVRGLILKGSPLVTIAHALRAVAAGGTYTDAALAGALAYPLASAG